MTYVIVPKSAAEVNQLVSLLHSHYCKNLLALNNPTSPEYREFAIGKLVVFWDDYTYATGVMVESSTIQHILKRAEPLTVNELGAYLN